MYWWSCVDINNTEAHEEALFITVPTSLIRDIYSENDITNFKALIEFIKYNGQKFLDDSLIPLVPWDQLFSPELCSVMMDPYPCPTLVQETGRTVLFIRLLVLMLCLISLALFFCYI